MKKRINVTDEVFNDLSVVAAELNSTGKKPNEKVENLFNSNLLLSSYRELQSLNSQLAQEVAHLKESNIDIDTEQMQRLQKLQTLEILDKDMSSALKKLIDSYVEVNGEAIQKAVLGL